jgi:hypothetical protein
VPVEFLSDQEAAGFGRYGESVSSADLERFFWHCQLDGLTDLRGTAGRVRVIPGAVSGCCGGRAGDLAHR